MKLLELLPTLDDYGRVRRESWYNNFLVRSMNENSPLVICNLHSLYIGNYLLTYEDLIADDWIKID